MNAGSSSLNPILNVRIFLDNFTNSTQVDCTNLYIAPFIFLALDLVIDSSKTYKGSLRLGPLWCPSHTLGAFHLPYKELVAHSLKKMKLGLHDFQRGLGRYIVKLYLKTLPKHVDIMET